MFTFTCGSNVTHPRTVRSSISGCLSPVSGVKITNKNWTSFWFDAASGDKYWVLGDFFFSFSGWRQDDAIIQPSCSLLHVVWWISLFLSHTHTPPHWPTPLSRRLPSIPAHCARAEDARELQLLCNAHYMVGFLRLRRTRLEVHRGWEMFDRVWSEFLFKHFSTWELRCPNQGRHGCDETDAAIKK